MKRPQVASGVRLARAQGLSNVVDLVYVPKRDIPATYLLDAAMEIGWPYAWARWRRGAR